MSAAIVWVEIPILDTEGNTIALYTLPAGAPGDA